MALAAGVLLFALFAADLLLHGPITSQDDAIGRWAHAQAHPVATALLDAVTRLHSAPGVWAMTAGLVIVLVARHRKRDIGWLFVTVGGGQLLNFGLKQVFHRARPHWDQPLAELATLSFPSGHASAATFFWGYVCVLVWTSAAPVSARRAVVALAAIMVTLTAVSRVYLGAHYPSDVLAAIAEGVAWVGLWQMVRARRERWPT